MHKIFLWLGVLVAIDHLFMDGEILIKQVRRLAS
jgi:hypothetical protein